MTRKTPQSRSVPSTMPKTTAPPTVSGRWLVIAGLIAVLASGVCAWGTLCLLFWQGSWQLLYHPSATVTQTPASVGLSFDPVAFVATDAGVARLTGWWIPAAADGKYARYTVLYLHGQAGNMGDSVGELAALHELGLNVMVFDYRGYGQSQFAHPSEAHWREDADWALNYLTGTRHLAAETVLLDGKGLGANLALEVGAEHAELGGVVLESPLERPVSAIFDDPRAGLVPARLLVRDRWDSEQAADKLIIPSLWVSPQGPKANNTPPSGYNRVTAGKTLFWLYSSSSEDKAMADMLSRWVDDLPVRTIGR